MSGRVMKPQSCTCRRHTDPSKSRVMLTTASSALASGYVMRCHAPLHLVQGSLTKKSMFSAALPDAYFFRAV